LFVSLTCCKSKTYNKSTPLCEFNGEFLRLNLGGSVEMLANPVAIAELAVEKGAATLLMLTREPGV
jgi:hypothetical protein